MPPDSSAIDDALVAKLLADSALMALMPDGVFWDVSGGTPQRFVIVSLVDEHDEPQFGERAYEDALYLVKAVALATSGGNVKAAARRIDELLENGTLSITGYALMTMHRDSRVAFTEPDDVDRSIRWQHRGGRYRLMVSG